MHLPLPRNRLVQLTLVGALLTTLVAAGLLAPGLFADHSETTDGGTTLGPDAPTPNDRFTPATSSGDDDHDESDAYEEREDRDEYEEYEDHQEEYEDEGEYP